MEHTIECKIIVREKEWLRERYDIRSVREANAWIYYIERNKKECETESQQ